MAGNCLNKSKTLQEERWPSCVCKVEFPVDCLVPFLFVNIKMCTDTKLPEKPEHGADQVGKTWTCVQGDEVQIPVAIPTTAVFFSFSRRMPRQYLELGPVASFQIAFRIVRAFNSTLYKHCFTHGCIKPGHLVAGATALCTVTPDIGGYRAWGLLHDTLQASRILMWLLDCGKSVHP
jgi:hypothetical protein